MLGSSSTASPSSFFFSSSTFACSPYLVRPPLSVSCQFKLMLISNTDRTGEVSQRVPESHRLSLDTKLKCFCRKQAVFSLFSVTLVHISFILVLLCAPAEPTPRYALAAVRLCCYINVVTVVSSPPYEAEHRLSVARLNLKLRHDLSV